MLYHTILYYTIPYHTILYCSILYQTQEAHVASGSKQTAPLMSFVPFADHWQVQLRNVPELKQEKYVQLKTYIYMYIYIRLLGNTFWRGLSNPQAATAQMGT